MLGFYLFVLCTLEGNWCRECGKLHLVFLVGGLGLYGVLGVVVGCWCMGRNVVLMPRGDRTRLMASVPLMYGMVVEVVIVGVCKGEVGLCEV